MNFFISKDIGHQISQIVMDAVDLKKCDLEAKYVTVNPDFKKRFISHLNDTVVPQFTKIDEKCEIKYCGLLFLASASLKENEYTIGV